MANSKKNQQSSAPIQTPSQSRGLSHVSQGVCNRCPLGTSRGANSSGGCSLCSAESYADELGLDECKPCPSRSSQAWMGTLQTMELRFSEMDLMLWFSTSDVKLYKLAKWSWVEFSRFWNYYLCIFIYIYILFSVYKCNILSGTCSVPLFDSDV